MLITRESIFVHSVRSFFSSLFVILGLAIGVLLIVLAFSFFSENKMLPDRTTLTVLPDAEGKRETLNLTGPVILRIDIHGIIGTDDLMHANIETILLDSRTGLLHGDRVKAILLHINTPGGTVCDSDGIYRTLMAYKKKYNIPVYAYADCFCASGGMYIASSADKIFANPTTLIGSVGVIIGPAFNFSQALDKIGVQSLTLTEGKDKDPLNPFRPWKEGEDASLRVIMSEFYEQFVDIVTKARPRINKETLKDDYGAKIFIAKQAYEYGYIDEANSSYAEALTALAHSAGIQDHYQVVQLQMPKSLLNELIKGNLLSGKIQHQLEFDSSLKPELAGKFLYLYK